MSCGRRTNLTLRKAPSTRTEEIDPERPAIADYYMENPLVVL